MAIARIGDKAFCPKHNGPFPIITGDTTFLVDGQPLACEGDYIACGCQLVAVKQSTVTVESGGSAAPSARSTAGAAAVPPAGGFVAAGTKAMPAQARRSSRTSCCITTTATSTAPRCAAWPTR
jgi:hypothetical protein